MNYLVTTRAGDRLHECEFFEVACAEMRRRPRAAMVVRATDGVILAYRTTPKRTTRKRGAA